MTKTCRRYARARTACRRQWSCSCQCSGYHHWGAFQLQLATEGLLCRLRTHSSGRSRTPCRSCGPPARSGGAQIQFGSLPQRCRERSKSAPWCFWSNTDRELSVVLHSTRYRHVINSDAVRGNVAKFAVFIQLEGKRRHFFNLKSVCVDTSNGEARSLVAPRRPSRSCWSPWSRQPGTGRAGPGCNCATEAEVSTTRGSAMQWKPSEALGKRSDVRYSVLRRRQESWLRRKIASAREPTASPFNALPRRAGPLRLNVRGAHMPHANATETPVNMR